MKTEIKKSSLYNEDIAPVPTEKRTWSALSFFSLWVGMSVCITTYMISSSMIDGGMDWKQALFTVFLGNLIVLIPMILNAHPGTKYGIPFPVLCRSSFGIRGANIPAVLRAIVACGWFGIQTWIGGGAILAVLLVVFPTLNDSPTLIPLLGTTLIQFVCFIIFWFINIYFIWKGMDSIKVLETLSAPFLIFSGLALLAWAYFKADGFGVMLSAPSKFQSTGDFYKFFFPSLTGMVGYWATLSLNISDFTRYAKDQKSQILGQAFGLPTTMTLFAFIGIAVTSATIAIYGEAIWDPIQVIQKFESPLIIFISMFAILLATLSTNIAANVVGPANDFSSLAPKLINFKMGGYITGVIGILMMPWKLIADPTGYIFTWLIGYSALLGPTCGILLTDYFLIRKTILSVEDLYKKNGIYSYTNGINIKAFVALVLGILPNLPGFLQQINVGQFPEIFTHLYHYAWFIGLGVAGISYYLLMITERKTHHA